SLRARSTSPRRSSSSASAAWRSTSSTIHASTPLRSTSRGVHASSQRERRSCVSSSPTRYPHRLLRLELRSVEGRVLRREAGEVVASALCAALRHGRGQQHLLPPSPEVLRRGVGRADPAGLP